MIKNKGSTAESSSGQLVESCMQYDFSVAQNDSGKREMTEDLFQLQYSGNS